MADTGKRGLDGDQPLYRDGSQGRRVKPVTDLTVGDVFLFDGQQWTVAEPVITSWGITEVDVEERTTLGHFEFNDTDVFEIVEAR